MGGTKNIDIFIQETHLKMLTAKRRPFSLGLNALYGTY